MSDNTIFFVGLAENWDIRGNKNINLVLKEIVRSTRGISTLNFRQQHFYWELVLFIPSYIYFLKDFIYLLLDRGEGREKERERSIHVWLPFMCPALGTWACALTGSWTSNPLVAGWRSTHWVTPPRAILHLFLSYYISMSIFSKNRPWRQCFLVHIFVPSMTWPWQVLKSV